MCSFLMRVVSSNLSYWLGGTVLLKWKVLNYHFRPRLFGRDNSVVQVAPVVQACRSGLDDRVRPRCQALLS
jgi:hypothetical protein